MNDTVATIRADLCVVGSGIAALNALAVASGYLQKGQRVVLIERRAQYGGMWEDAHPFVRLHQPPRLFTAGAVPRRGGPPPPPPPAPAGEPRPPPPPPPR